MLKSLFRKIILLPFIILISGCTLETNIKAEFLLENNFKMVKEFENGNECLDEERWFLFVSTFSTHSDESYELTLQYKNGDNKKFNGQYKIYVGNEGHSGEGYFIFNENKINITFQNSYFLIFELPVEYNPSGCEQTRELHFQRW